MMAAPAAISAANTREYLVYQLIDMIDRGEYSPTGRLPSQRRLAEYFGVSRNSIIAALDVLTEHRLITRSKGRGGGTVVLGADPNRVPVAHGPGFVATSKMQRKPGVVVSVPQLLQEQGFLAATRVISVVVCEAEAEIADKLGVPQGSKVAQICRVRLANGEPLSYEQAYLPCANFPKIEDMDFRRSLYEILVSEYHVHIKSTTERIEVIGASRQAAQLLGIKQGSPVFFITRWTVDAQGAGVEFSRDIFRVDRTQLFVHSTGT
jgi:GntR family transcriptional regulator